MYKIPFNRPCLAGNELNYIKQAVESGHIAGDGLFTKKCTELMENKFKANKVMLTSSCTHALEMTALLLNIEPGDEIIVPSYTFVSSVNAFILRGARPVFVDIRPDTLNIDENKIEEKITKKTKAIVVIHYAGVSCDMDKILKIAEKRKIAVVEDAAHGLNAKYKDKFLGTMGTFGTYSFHETKNYICGEGGALVINDRQFIARAEIIREKGTDRSQFFRGEIDKYTWCDIGSSYLPSEIQSAFLFAQLEKMEEIQKKRNEIFQYYMDNLEEFERSGKCLLPKIPKDCLANYHMFYVLLDNLKQRDQLIAAFKENGILAVFHYVPLHLSPMGQKYGYKEGCLPITEQVSQRILRLPFYNDITVQELNKVVKTISKIFNKKDGILQEVASFKE